MNTMIDIAKKPSITHSTTLPVAVANDNAGAAATPRIDGKKRTSRKLTVIAQDPLIHGLRTRSRRAASDLYRRFAPSMLAMAKKRVAYDDAEEVLQDAMLAALCAKEYPDTIPELERWLHGLVFRAVHARRRMRAREEPHDAVAFLEDPEIDEGIKLAEEIL